MLIAGLFIPLWILIPLALLILTVVSNILTIILAPIIGATIIFKIIKFVFKLLKILFPLALIGAGGYLLFAAIL